MSRAPKVWLTAEQQDDFVRFARSQTLAARLVERSKIVLQAAAGKADIEIAQALGITRQTVGLWRRRFLDRVIAGIEKDAPRSGRPRLIAASKIDEIVSLTTRQKPANATHWSTRTLAEVAAVSASTVGRIWRAHGLKPHRVRTFKLSNDPRFAEKLEDVISLHLHPPDLAIVLSVDEKCQIQDPGSGSYAAWLALEKGALWDHDPRLQAARYHYSVCRHEHPRRKRNRRLHAHPQSLGLDSVSQTH
jgi:transposase